MIFIAEIGLNYNGNFDLIYEMIKKAKYSGATICKFQLGWRDGPGEINQLDEKKIKQIIIWCESFKIESMFSIISEKAYSLIKKFNVNKIKIASRSLKYDFNLVKKIVNENKKKNIYMSLGMWNKTNLPFKNSNISYLWCVSKYPAYNIDLKKFPKNFIKSKLKGYSDHTIGIDACLIAISRGAKVIEKHFTLDKSNTTIRDHSLSATPDEFRQMVELGTEIEKKVNFGI